MAGTELGTGVTAVNVPYPPRISSLAYKTIGDSLLNTTLPPQNLH